MVNNHKTIVPKFTGDKINKVLKHLFYINSYGQVDGSGIMWTEADKKTYYTKEEGPSPELIDGPVFKAAYSNLYNCKFVAGHTRYSTVGANSEDNSHPFLEGNYLGMQNGTISNNHTAIVPNEVSPCEVDSNSVFWAMNKQGVKKTLDYYEGAAVFMFMDLKNDTFNIVKNSERNLHKVKVTGFDVWVFCTDKYALELAFSRAALAIDEVQEVPNDTLFTYTVGGVVTENEQVVKESFSTPYKHTYYNNYSGYKDWYGYKGEKKSNTVVPFVKRKELPNTYTPPTNALASEYTTDCVMCSSPLYSLDVMYGDSNVLSACNYVSCSCCVSATEGMIGSKLMYITDKKDPLLW